MSRDVGLSRRTALGGAAAVAAVAVTGCTPSGIDRRPRAAAVTRSPGTDPDVALAATVLADEQRMLDRVLATLRRHPGLEPTLAASRSAHRAHVDLLTDAVPDEARTTPSTSASPAVSPSVSPSPASTPRVPARVPAALSALSREEDRLGLLGRRSAFAAESGAFARVLASMAAAASQQSAALASAAKGAR